MSLGLQIGAWGNQFSPDNYGIIDFDDWYYRDMVRDGLIRHPFRYRKPSAGLTVVLKPLPLVESPAMFEAVRVLPSWQDISPIAMEQYRKNGYVVYRLKHLLSH